MCVLRKVISINQSALNIPLTTVGENFTVRTLKEAIATNKSAPNIPPAAVAENVIEFMQWAYPTLLLEEKIK